MEIRPIRADEAALCAGVIRRSFQTVADTFGLTAENAPRFTAFAVTPERIGRQLAEGRPVIGTFEGADLAGCCSLHDLGGGLWELNHLCVLPERRHGGLGGALLRDAFERARALGCVRMTIGIIEENRVLKRWYESYGFIPAGTRKFDFFPFTCGYLEKKL